jgi:hypothetical protein
MKFRTDFDRVAWETWLETQRPDRAEAYREGMGLADWFEIEYEKIQKEREDGHHD